MSDIKRCMTCKGFKSIAPLGGIVKECVACNGIGYEIAVPVQQDVPRMIRKLKKKKRKDREHFIYQLRDKIEQAQTNVIQSNNDVITDNDTSITL